MLIKSRLNFRSRILQSYNMKSAIIKARLDSIALPNKLQGTIVEKWAKYWKQLLLDYQEVVIDVGKQAKEKPKKAIFLASLAAGSYYCTKNNPDEKMFIEQLRYYNNEIVQVHESLHNPVSEQYLKFIERCYNEGIVRRLSIGVLSFLWLDNYDKGTALYKATCPYLKPKYLTFHERIIDVGFLNQWWILKDKMKDYDINY